MKPLLRQLLPMANILQWITNTKNAAEPLKPVPATTGNIEDDWCLLEEWEEPVDEDLQSSIATIEQINLAKSQTGEGTLKKYSERATSLGKIAPTLQTTLTAIQNSMAANAKKSGSLVPDKNYQNRVYPNLAELKDRELKLRKMKKRRHLKSK
jgi:hypothetical protein